MSSDSERTRSARGNEHEWQVDAPITARLTWDYEPRSPRTLSLIERARAAQWSAKSDVDWSTEVEFGAPLPNDSTFSMSSFESSPFARRGRESWDLYRWEFQSWMISQFLHGEQGALVAAARLVEMLPDLENKQLAVSQVVDEARHVEVFSRYLREKVPEPYPISDSLSTLLGDILSDSRWDVTALGMQIMVEALAMAAFRMANTTFHDDLIRDITRLVARDEARHVSFGVLSLKELYTELTDAERREREEVVLDAAQLMRRRFLLEDIWDRIDVSRADGMHYALTDPLMIAYRQAIFAKIVSALGQIGLLTERVRDGMSQMNLLGFSANRRVLASR
ncbi:ferritin-like domain-containing protein [Nocardia brasiliensis]|uniref:ferritin-like domain-containing protein n=1 Tax=Nocardia brasiliensis TaxID=37326 RepID=UPI00366EE810